MELVAAAVVGALVVVLVLVLARRLGGDRDDVVSGLPMAPPPGASASGSVVGEPARAPKAKGPDRRGSSFSMDATPVAAALDGRMQQMVAKIHEALADDGQLSDEDVARLFPGATVVRSGGDVQIEHTRGWGALDWDQDTEHHHVEWQVGPTTEMVIEVDGRRVHDPSEIDDPTVRAKVEQLLRDRRS